MGQEEIKAPIAIQHPVEPLLCCCLCIVYIAYSRHSDGEGNVALLDEIARTTIILHLAIDRLVPLCRVSLLCRNQRHSLHTQKV